MNERVGIFGWLVGGGAGLALVAAIIFFIAGHASVDVHEVGVETSFGHVERTLPPGFYWKQPFTEDVRTISTQVQHKEYTKLAASSSENFNVSFDVSVNYRVDPKRAAHVIVDVGDDYVSKIFDHSVADYLKEIVPKYAAQEIKNNRGTIREALKTALNTRSLTYGVDTVDVFIQNFDFDRSYDDAIKNRAIAQQNLATAEIDKQRQITTAQGEAEAQRLKQTAVTDLTIRDKEADNTRAAINKWNGQMPTYQGGAPLINITGPTK